MTLTGLYNVLEKLRAGTAPTALEESDRRTFDDGLVLIMQELHDKLDAAVFDAYGWPATLTDDEILTRLVALNKARAKEEQSGQVRWLRPDYQIPRFGSQKEKAELDLLGADISQAEATGPKPNYPNDGLEQVYAVMAVLSRATAPMDANSIALTFKQGRKIAPKITEVLAAGLRYGDLNSTDGGRTYQLRRAA